MDVNISLSPSRLPFLPVLRHLQPAVQVVLLSQLAQQLAEQLDCERGNRQRPVFEASVPLSDSQFQKLPVPKKLKSFCFRMQGLQCLEQCLKERWTQEVVDFSSYSKCCILLKSATIITKGSVSYLSSPCFSTSLGGIGGPAHGIHGILAVMYWISIIRGGAPPPRKWSWV